MNNRKYPRIKIKEQSCKIDNASVFDSADTDEREASATISDFAYGGACITTNISAKVKTILLLNIPSTESLPSFSIKSEILRVSLAHLSTPLKPRFNLGLKFINPDVKLIDKFMKLSSESLLPPGSII